jgi:hypothetical protein
VASGKTYAIIFLSLTTVAGAVVAWKQHQELVTLRAASLMPNERADWQKRLWAAEKSRAELETKVTKEAKDPHLGASVEEPVTAEEPRFNRRNGAGNFMALMNQPEIQRLMAVQQKAALDARYSALFKNLALTPDQLEKFKDLLVEKRTSMMDVVGAAREQGINRRSDPEAFAKLVASAQSEIDSNIRATLGEAGFSQYENYEKTLPQRNVVDQLEQRLSYSSTPLTSQQSEQMVAILQATSPGRNSGTPSPLTALGTGLSATFGGNAGGGTRITDATITQAQGLLAGPQLDALRQLQQEQHAQAQLNAAMRNRFQGNGGGAAAPAPAAPPGPTGNQ